MDDDCCFVCTNELDATDTSISFCECDLALCLWCYHRICEEAAKEDKPARCPNCRAEYDKERIQNQRLEPEQLEEVKRKQRKEERRKTGLPLRPRKDLANVRVVQRNLVYVVGLALELCYEDLLKTDRYFGQFGKIIKISTSRSGPYGTAAAKNGPTGSAYITYKNIADARRCIETVHGETWEGKSMKACYGTTKYCNAFLKGLPCNNVECLYLHDVAEEEDSYTKEETKTPRFVNLVHAASIQKQQGQPGQAVTANGHTPRSGAYASEDAFAQQSAEQLERSGLVTSSLPEPLEQQGPAAGASAWPALGGSSWAAKAVTPAPPQAPPPPPPPVEAVQEWPTLGGAPSDAADSLPAFKGPAGLPPVAAQLQRKGSTMAAEIARAASTPSGSAAGGAAAKDAQKPAGPGTVLVVPKKKQSSPPLRTPKKPAAAPAADASSTNGSHAGASEESTAAASAMPAAAAEAASKAVAAALRKPKAPKQAADARSAGLGDEQLLEDLDQALAEGQQREQQSQDVRSPAVGVKPEYAEQRKSLDSKPSEGAAPVASEQVSKEAPELGVKPKKPPPGFESVNGAVKPSNRAKKGPPPGFAGPAEQQAQAMNGSTSSFPSFSSESSFMSAAQEALTAAINAPVPAPAARKPNGIAQWDVPPPSVNHAGSGNIWGTDTNVQTDPFLQQRAARSRSRFDFAQDATQTSSTGAHVNGTASGLGFAQWANPAAGSDPAGRELLWQLQSGAQSSQPYGMYGGSQLVNGGAFSSFPAGQQGHEVGQYGQGSGQQQQQQAAPMAGYGGYGQPHAAMQQPQQMTAQDLQWLDTAQRFQNMAV